MQKLPLSRTRFGSDIVAEFLPPERSSNKVLILLSGMPGYPGGKDEVMAYYARRGYWVIAPRYRGTWESAGTFLEQSPAEDVVIVMDNLHAFDDLWSGAKHCIKDPEVYLIGGSFSGPAALLASKDAREKKAVTISGVADWRLQEHTAEPLDLMSMFVPSAFGMAYRADASVWKKLAEGNFYNPATESEGIEGAKILMLHGRDDRVVHAGPGEALAHKIGAMFVMLRTDEHMGASAAARPALARRIEKHFKGR